MLSFCLRKKCFSQSLDFLFQRNPRVRKSQRAGQEDGFGEDGPLRGDGEKLQGQWGQGALRQRGKGGIPSLSVPPMASARARPWKQRGWAKKEAEKGGQYSAQLQEGQLQWLGNGSVVNLNRKQASCGWCVG